MSVVKTKAGNMAEQKFAKVAVLMGGHSAEREVSLMSGEAVLGALRSKGVNAYAFDPANRALSELKSEGFDVAFIALHGRGGEDGSLQGALQWMGIPYTGSGVMASSISMDKWRTKLVWIAAGLPTPRFRILYADTNWDEVVGALGLPIFVKPAHEGSSLGATKVMAKGELQAAWELAAGYDSLVIAEEFVSGEEVTVPFLGDQVLPAVRIQAPDGNYDYQNKYFTDSVKYHCPSGLAPEIETNVQDLVRQAAQVLGCRGWGRADFILRDGVPTLLEMNTAPGMTGHSLVPMSARAAGIDFESLCLQILAGAQLD